MVATRTAEAIAREYEDFAYIVSHDLSAPLRHVREFTQLLVEARGQNLTDDEKSYVGFLEKSLLRIDRMQEALLAFSRVNTQAAEPEEVDCKALVLEILENFTDEIKAKKAEIFCGDLPVVRADYAQLRQVFYHLISNALKFYEEGAVTNVSIEGRKEGKVFVFEVRDNGIGIAPEYHEEIFRMFRRLNPEKYPGTGAGLTIARKIARRHGGDLRVDSIAGEGARAVLTLPVEPKAA